MHLDLTITLGNLIEIGSIVGAGLFFAARTMLKFAELFTRVDGIENRLDRIELQNTQPVSQRHYHG